ncbi:MAG: pantetheine-phosphate adenylyltransferase [Candidatus Omnitrophica bacterium]|nr:pantetheine-phosphate adenylyltransferase [Candidatus Omnitrophota bacterium]
MRHTKGVYPGTFDPVTYGHIDLIKRALGIFDEVVVAVAHHSTEKSPLFTVKERVDFLKEATRGLPGVTVSEFEGLIVEYARKIGASAMIRGVRMISDFEYEFQMALTNRKLADDVETLFLMPHESYSYLSSRLIKEIARLRGDVSAFVPGPVWNAIQKKFK